MLVLIKSGDEGHCHLMLLMLAIEKSAVLLLLLLRSRRQENKCVVAVSRGSITPFSLLLLLLYQRR